MQNFYKHDYIDDLHIEPTARCNAACPMCLRNNHGDMPNERLIEQDLDLKLLDNIDMDIKRLTLAGNYGDPLMHPTLIDIVKWYLSKFDGGIHIQSNGGARTTDWWQDLAKAGGDRLLVTFGIDGLENTNHLYRRKVRWDKLMENTKAFIDAGGNASWKMLVFKHNEHQIEDARKLAFSMGFNRFQRVITNRFPNDKKFPVINAKNETLYHLEEATIDNNYTAKNPSRLAVDYTEETAPKISCYAVRDTSAYLAADGRVYPCCNTGYHYNNNMYRLQARHQKYNLKNYKLSEIVNGDLFCEIRDRWSTNRPVSICKRVCSMARDNLMKEEFKQDA